MLGWILLTILVFIFGPYEYDIIRPVIFYFYLLGLLLSIFLGYKRGQNTFGRGSRLRINYYKFTKQTILFSLSYFFLKVVIIGGGDFVQIFNTLRDPSLTYTTSSVRVAPTLFVYMDMFFHPFSLIAITNVVFSYKKLPKRYRYAGYFLIFISLGQAIGAATRSGIVQNVILLTAAFTLGVYRKNIILKFKHKVRIFVTLILFLITFLGYSFLLTTSRDGNIIILNPITNEPPKDDYFIDQITPDEINPLTYNIAFYISHSYYNLNKAMNLSFEGLGFGLSNSYFIMDNIEAWTGWSGPKELSYGLRVEKEAGARGFGLYWSTFYTWIASDVTWPGTLIVMYFLAYSLSLALNDSLAFQNPLSVTSFCVLFYFIFHSVFNNPMQDGQGIISMFVLPMIWFNLRKKYYDIN